MDAMKQLTETMDKVTRGIPSEDEIARRLLIAKDRYYTDRVIAEMYQANGSPKPLPEEPTRQSVIEQIRAERGILEF